MKSSSVILYCDSVKVNMRGTMERRNRTIKILTNVLSHMKNLIYNPLNRRSRTDLLDYFMFMNPRLAKRYNINNNSLMFKLNIANKSN